MTDRPLPGRASLRGAVRIGLWLGLTLLCVPVQWLALRFGGGRFARWLPRFYHRTLCGIMGLRLRVVGAPPAQSALFVGNHSSYLDIVVLGSRIEGSFVAKADMDSWPLFGLLARLQRTVYVDRRRAAAGRHRDELARRLARRDTLILFPEGTSSDGNRVLPVKSALFAALAAAPDMVVQPFALVCTRIEGLPAGRTFRPTYAWYGDMELAPHLWAVMTTGCFDLELHLFEPVVASSFGDRKALARHVEARVRAGVAAAVTGRPVPPAGVGGARPLPALRPLPIAAEAPVA